MITHQWGGLRKSEGGGTKSVMFEYILLFYALSNLTSFVALLKKEISLKHSEYSSAIISAQTIKIERFKILGKGRLGVG